MPPQRHDGAWLALIALAICGLIAALFTGCSTIAPKPVNSQQPSYLGSTNADSGQLVIYPDGSELVTDAVRVKYNGLIHRYGNSPLFIPPLTFDVGISKTELKDARGNPIWLLDADHVTDYLLMCQWLHDGR